MKIDLNNVIVEWECSQCGHTTVDDVLNLLDGSPICETCMQCSGAMINMKYLEDGEYKCDEKYPDEDPAYPLNKWKEEVVHNRTKHGYLIWTAINMLEARMEKHGKAK